MGGPARGLRGLLRAGRPRADRWRAEGLGPAATAALRAEAEAERRQIDRLLLATDAAVHRSRAQLTDMPLPEGTDWRWRPPLMDAPLSPAGRVGPQNGEGLGDSAQLFHDCPAGAMILRQVPNRQATDLARYGLSLEVLGFEGRFLSLALPMPAEMLDGLDRSHVIQLDSQMEIERPLEVFARLNIVNGPNTDRIQAHLGWMQPGRANQHVTAFDLAETEINPLRLESAWLDLILEAPVMNRVVLRDLVVSRHRRADV